MKILNKYFKKSILLVIFLIRFIHSVSTGYVLRYEIITIALSLSKL